MSKEQAIADHLAAIKEFAQKDEYLRTKSFDDIFKLYADVFWRVPAIAALSAEVEKKVSFN